MSRDITAGGRPYLLGECEGVRFANGIYNLIHISDDLIKHSNVTGTLDCFTAPLGSHVAHAGRRVECNICTTTTEEQPHVAVAPPT